MYANTGSTTRTRACIFAHTHEEDTRGKRYNKRSNAGVSLALLFSSGSTLYKLMCSYANPCYDYVPASRSMYTRVLSPLRLHTRPHILRERYRKRQLNVKHENTVLR